MNNRAYFLRIRFGEHASFYKAASVQLIHTLYSFYGLLTLLKKWKHR